MLSLSLSPANDPSWPPPLAAESCAVASAVAISAAEASMAAAGQEQMLWGGTQELVLRVRPNHGFAALSGTGR